MSSQIDYLRDQLVVCTLNEFPVLREALLPHKDKLVESLWEVGQDEQRCRPVKDFRLQQRWRNMPPTMSVGRRRLRFVVTTFDDCLSPPCTSPAVA